MSHTGQVAYYKFVTVGGDRGHEAPRRVFVPQEHRVSTWLAFRRRELRKLSQRLGLHEAVVCYRDGTMGRIWI